MTYVHEYKTKTGTLRLGTRESLISLVLEIDGTLEVLVSRCTEFIQGNAKCFLEL